MEKKIEELTKTLLEHCRGKEASIVIGAAFNVAQTALNAVPDKRVLAAVAATLRSQADMLEKSISGRRH